MEIKIRDRVPEYLGKAFGKTGRILLNYVAPIYAGGYVGYMDGSNNPLTTIERTAWLTSPTAAAFTGYASLYKLVKTIYSKVLNHPKTKSALLHMIEKRLRKSISKGTNGSSLESRISEELKKVERTANLNVIKESLKQSAKPALSTMAGYIAGYVTARLTQ